VRFFGWPYRRKDVDPSPPVDTETFRGHTIGAPAPTAALPDPVLDSIRGQYRSIMEQLDVIDGKLSWLMEQHGHPGHRRGRFNRRF
jgi:hypothetical protein